MQDAQLTTNEFWLTNARLITMEHGELGYKISPPTTIYIKHGRIESVNEPAPTGSTQVIDCAERLVTPGFIDCHTHLVYVGNRANEFEMRLKGTSYQEISANGGGILSTVRATRSASEQQLVELALPRLDGLLRSGVTTVEIKSGYGLTLQDELKMLRAAKALQDHRLVNVSTTLLAAHATPPEYTNNPNAYIDYVCNEIIPAVSEQNLATSVDVFCESIGFNLAQTEQVFLTAKQHGLAIKGHTEQLSNLGGSALTAKYQGLSADHIEYLDEQGVKALAESGTVATLLPGAFYFLKETQQPPIELLRKHQVPMAVATDINPGTSPFADLTMMMNMSCTLFGLTPEEALRGVTSNAAKALGLADRIGQLRVGYQADIAIWDIDHPADFSYLQGVSRLYARLVGGKVDYV